MRLSGFGEMPVVINDEEKMGSSESWWRSRGQGGGDSGPRPTYTQS